MRSITWTVGVEGKESVRLVMASRRLPRFYKMKFRWSYRR